MRQWRNIYSSWLGPSLKITGDVMGEKILLKFTREVWKETVPKDFL